MHPKYVFMCNFDGFYLLFSRKYIPLVLWSPFSFCRPNFILNDMYVLHHCLEFTLALLWKAFDMLLEANQFF